MKNQFVPSEAGEALLDQRTYTSRLLGREPSLVLHGGGNTSVKIRESDFFGDPVDVLYVKGSGWDLASIEPAGFSPVRLDVLRRLAECPDLSDVDMVRQQRAALLDPSAPNPSVEAILHAVLPHRFVDHTHADAVVTLTNTPNGEARVRELYGDRVLVVPYVMPGFVLARRVYEMIQDVKWDRIEGMVLLNHGVFTFGETAEDSYSAMIRMVDEAETALERSGAFRAVSTATGSASTDLRALASLRRRVSEIAQRPLCAVLDDGPDARGFAGRADAGSLATRGTVTPDHVIRTKPKPAVVGDGGEDDISAYAAAYRDYFQRHDTGQLQMLDPAPRWLVWRNHGTVAFGTQMKAAQQTADIIRHSLRCFQWGEALGGWTPLDEASLFEMEYWELEQRKVRSNAKSPPFTGQIALITGAAGGIGATIAEAFSAQGAAVCAVDIQSKVVERFDGPTTLGVQADLTDPSQVEAAVHACVRRFGGLDLLVTNAGTFPAGAPLGTLDLADWQRTVDINLTSHLALLQSAVPFLECGISPSVLVMGSRNVPAPGPGASAYSASKAALTQLARVASLELGPKGVRVNVLHPDKVFDTDLWTEEKVAARAAHYGLTVEQYKRSNLLSVPVTSQDVAAAALALSGPTFRCTTGAQVSVDGGSDRVI